MIAEKLIETIFYSIIDYPQNLNSHRRKLRFETDKWLYVNETSSSSGNDSPPPLSPPLKTKSTSLSPCLSLEHASNCRSDKIPSEANQKEKEKEAAIPYRRRRLHQVSFPLVLRRSSRLKSEMRKSTRPHCTSAGEGTCFDFKRTKKVKPGFTKLKSIYAFWLYEFSAIQHLFLYCFSEPRSCAKFVDKVHNDETESPKSYEVDDIDGFLIWSFATALDLGKFCAEQLSRDRSSKETPNSPIEGTEASFIFTATDGLQTKKTVG